MEALVLCIGSAPRETQYQQNKTLALHCWCCRLSFALHNSCTWSVAGESSSSSLISKFIIVILDLSLSSCESVFFKTSTCRCENKMLSARSYDSCHQMGLRDRMEKSIFRRRQEQAIKQEQLESNSKYFSDWTAKADKYQSWSSDKFFKTIALEQETRKGAEERANSLEARRVLLRTLYETEFGQWQQELDKEIMDFNKKCSIHVACECSTYQMTMTPRKLPSPLSFIPSLQEMKDGGSVGACLKCGGRVPVPVLSLDSPREKVIWNRDTSGSVVEFDKKTKLREETDEFVKKGSESIQQEIDTFEHSHTQGIQNTREQKQTEIDVMKREWKKLTQQATEMTTEEVNLRNEINDAQMSKDLLFEAINTHRRMQPPGPIRKSSQVCYMARSLCANNLKIIADDMQTLDYLRFIVKGFSNNLLEDNFLPLNRLNSITALFQKQKMKELAFLDGLSTMFQEDVKTALRAHEHSWDHFVQFKSHQFSQLHKELFDAISSFLKELEDKFTNTKTKRIDLLKTIEKMQTTIVEKEEVDENEIQDMKLKMKMEVEKLRKLKGKDLMKSIGVV